MSRINQVSDMELDEISLVDRPANQHAVVAIAKRASQEDVVSDYYDDDGAVVDLNTLPSGSIVYDETGEAYEWDTTQEAVAKSDPGAIFGTRPATANVGKSFTADQIREELSKAVTETDRDEVIAKALGELSKSEQRAARAEQIAKAEQDLRLRREYIAKASEYNVPIAADELGPVLLGMATAEFEGALPEGSCAVIHKALSSAGEMLFKEVGFDGNADNNDPMAEIEAIVNGQVAKGGSGVSREAAISKYFEENPRAYDEYAAGLGR